MVSEYNLKFSSCTLLQCNSNPERSLRIKLLDSAAKKLFLRKNMIVRLKAMKLAEIQIITITQSPVMEQTKNLCFPRKIIYSFF